MSGKICGTKSRGRQHTKYTDSLNKLVTRKESPNNEGRTDDREDWKAMVADVWSRPELTVTIIMISLVLDAHGHKRLLPSHSSLIHFVHHVYM